MVTSNRRVGEWGEVFGDPVVATAILDRLLHHSHVVTTRGDSDRLRVAAQDRAGLERLLRYCARPPFALGRLVLLDEERVVYLLPKPQRDGTTALSPTPLELIDHLAALIPPARRHRHRYHGALAPNSPLRATAIVYGRDATKDPNVPAEVA